jgi:hypothetical protein
MAHFTNGLLFWMNAALGIKLLASDSEPGLDVAFYVKFSALT